MTEDGKTPTISAIRRTLRAFWRVVIARAYYKRRGELDVYAYGPGDYCPRCGGCGVDECCPPTRCDHGAFCAKQYGGRQ